MSRYDVLPRIISEAKPKCILEVGTWNGKNAVRMATQALKNGPVHYIGVDLFEEATAESDAAELNVKAHASLSEVTERLEEFQFVSPGFTFELHKGNSRDILPTLDLSSVEMAFIDGGHSVETVSSDLAAVESVPLLVVDDFYVKDDQDRCPDITQFGCNAILQAGTAGMGWLVLPDRDPVITGGYVQMAVRGWKPPMNLVVKTKNCVPDEMIQENIAFALASGLPLLEVCRQHSERAVLVSAGPSVKDQLDEIRSTKGKIVCVKHAHDLLIENGIIPWACVLLDPRPHVQDFIENPHPDVTYIVASMCHRSTLERLIERKAKVVLYHAMVGAGENKIIKEGFFVGGGSCAATRGIAVLHVLGFRKMVLYGYDSCYPEKPTGPREDYQKVSVMGRSFWTDMELVAQAQDFEKLLQQGFVDLTVKGDGMISHIWKKRRPQMTLSQLEARLG